MRNLIAGTTFPVMLMSALPANAYLMQILTYSNLYERADVVAIATPVETKDSLIPLKLEVDQPKDVTDLITTVSTQLTVSLLLKRKVTGDSLRLLHLNWKDQHESMMFGDVGTFFIDFDAEHNKQKSFLLFMKSRKDGTFCPAWRPMEGSRAIMPIKKDKTL